MSEKPAKKPPPICLSAKRAEMQGRGGGLACPRCGGRLLKVVRTYGVTDRAVRRRRECCHCGNRFTTSERLLRDAAKES